MEAYDLNPQQSAPYRVLIVDDLESNRMLLRHVLRKPEFELQEAADGAQALGILRRGDVDAVLMDIMMPGMDGLETCRHIRDDLHLNLLPVIMVTSLGATGDVVQGMAAGASDYVTREYDSHELKARVRAAIKQKRLTDRLDDTESVLFSLARMVEARDNNTGDHCDRLSHMAVVFGKSLGLHYDELEALRRGGILHDIGKLAIPDAVLLKKDKLTEQEWDVMKQHPTIGAALCSPLQTMKKPVDIIRCHHEKWNGEGYPAGLAGEQIPLLARVFQIVDIYDALSSERPYKPAFPVEKVIAIMQAETAKGFWDPVLMRTFIDLVRNRPGELEYTGKAYMDRSRHIFGEIVNAGLIDQ